MESGKLKYVLVDMPLAMHKLAFKAAEVASCAADEGKLWEMYHRLFENQRNLEPWNAHAESLGLDLAKFEECLNSGKHAAEIRKDLALAQSTGARGTPSFVLGVTDPEDSSKVSGLVFIRGAQPYRTFKTHIDTALSDLLE